MPDFWKVVATCAAAIAAVIDHLFNDKGKWRGLAMIFLP